MSKQKASLFFRLSISVTVFGALFKSIPSLFIVLGAAGMVLFLGIQLYQKEQRALLDYARLLLILSFSANYTCNLVGLPYEHLLAMTTKLALIAFLILYIKTLLGTFQNLLEDQSSLLSGFGRENLSLILADLATVYIAIASLFEILHWEMGVLNGQLLLVIGLLAAVLSILASPRALRM